MVGVVGFSIAQVGRRELIVFGRVIGDTGQPYGFEIEQMACVFLGGPLSRRVGGEKLMRAPAKRVFQPGGSAAEPCGEIGKQFDREGKVEGSFEPQWDRKHEATNDKSLLGRDGFYKAEADVRRADGGFSFSAATGAVTHAVLICTQKRSAFLHAFRHAGIGRIVAA